MCTKQRLWIENIYGDWKGIDKTMDWFNTDDYCRLQRSTQTQMRTHTFTKRNVSRRWYEESKKTDSFLVCFRSFCVLRKSETQFDDPSLAKNDQTF